MLTTCTMDRLRVFLFFSLCSSTEQFQLNPELNLCELCHVLKRLLASTAALCPQRSDGSTVGVLCCSLTFICCRPEDMEDWADVDLDFMGSGSEVQVFDLLYSQTVPFHSKFKSRMTQIQHSSLISLRLICSLLAVTQFLSFGPTSGLLRRKCLLFPRRS